MSTASSETTNRFGGKCCHGAGWNESPWILIPGSIRKLVGRPIQACRLSCGSQRLACPRGVQKNPVIEGRGLADRFSVPIQHRPEQSVLDQESFPSPRNAHSPIVVDKALLASPFQESSAIFLMYRFGRFARWHREELVEGHFPKFQGHAIPVFEDWVALEAVGNDHLRRFPKRLQIPFTRRAVDQFPSCPLPVRIEQGLSQVAPCFAISDVGKRVHR